MTVDVSFISLAKLLGPIAAVAARATSTCWRWSSPSSSSAPSGSARAGWSARPRRPPRRAARGGRAAASDAGLVGPRLRLVRAARPEGEPRDLHLVRAASRREPIDVERARWPRVDADESGPPSSSPTRTPRPRPRASPRPSRPRSEAGVELVAPPTSTSKHGEAAEGLGRVEELPEQARRLHRPRWRRQHPLRAAPLRRQRGARCSGSTSAPSASWPRSSASSSTDGLRRALAGEFEVMAMPGAGAGGWTVEHARSPSTTSPSPAAARPRRGALLPDRPARRSGNVRCDGLVAATPAGSTGYNLANAGPILAWGVEGYVVSFIAPHTLTARALVVAPGDVLQVAERRRPRPGRDRARRRPLRRARARRGGRGLASATASAASPSSPARASTPACARSSAASPSSRSV